eukprot:CAMPEP_0171269036 /NCGR_PEP_ID=MMETSP0790-20130122/59983_1 /TAXON_ID=2925 /ORGANISM="Alexandrium catenella, Strain OF101" /LENGTH=65 /DNA_ID=CAMNT_0011737823 /DNA_START=20 /DNA_END=214 /DNA_ORIENTATION=+
MPLAWLAAGADWPRSTEVRARAMAITVTPPPGKDDRAPELRLAALGAGGRALGGVAREPEDLHPP